MKKLRKINRTKRKQERKAAQEKLATQTSLMMGHPTECCICAKGFERTHQTVKTWHVTVVEQTARLTCPTCLARVTERLENIKNEN